MTRLEDELRAYGLAGEPITYAPVLWQPIVAAIRAANVDLSLHPTAEAVLTLWNPDITPARVLIGAPPAGTFHITNVTELTVTFIDNDHGLNLPPENVHWDFGDETGPLFASTQQVEHTYDWPGTYLVTKRVAVAGTIYSSELEVTVGDIPEAMFDPDDYTVAEVKVYANLHADEEDELQALLDMETNGKHRGGLIHFLEALIEALH